MRTLLLQIKAGVSSFKPKSASKDDVRQVQLVAEKLLDAERLNYISSALPHYNSDSYSGLETIDLVAVGEITKEGIDFLEKRHA